MKELKALDLNGLNGLDALNLLDPLEAERVDEFFLSKLLDTFLEPGASYLQSHE